MDKTERHDLKCDIKVSKQDNYYHLYDFFTSWITAMARSTITFGINSKATKETFKTLQEYYQNLKKEHSLYDYLYRHSKSADNEATGEYLQEIFELSEDTFTYYIDFLDEIIVACDLNQEHRVIRAKKSFATLLESNEFFAKLLELLIDKDNILSYIHVNKEFIKFINEDNFRVAHIDYNNPREREFIGVNVKVNSEGNIADIKIFVPTITNLETASIYCHEMAKAFAYFKLIGKPLTIEDEKNILDYSNLQTESFRIHYREREKKLLPYK